MAVVIVNVSEENGQEYGKGLQTYKLKINYNTLLKFTHTFEDRLASCLRAAADALEEQEKEDD